MIHTSVGNIHEIRKHYIYVDFWERFLGEFLSTPLVALIANTKITPNHITCVGICCNILAGIFFATGHYSYLVLGAVVSQVSYVLDFADGQLARYKNMRSVKGAWLDIIGDSFSDCVIFAGLGYGYYSHSGEITILYITLFGCSIHPLYSLHRQVRNKLIGENESGIEAEKHMSSGLNDIMQRVKYYSINRKLLITLGALANLVQMTLIVVVLMVSLKFFISALAFLVHGTREHRPT